MKHLRLCVLAVLAVLFIPLATNAAEWAAGSVHAIESVEEISPAESNDSPHLKGELTRRDRDCQNADVLVQAQSWCCCRGCCGYAINCRAIPGCPRC